MMHKVLHNFGDWELETRYMTRTERSIYFDMRTLYLKDGKPLTDDLSLLERLLMCHSDDEKEALAFLLSHKFRHDKKSNCYKHREWDLVLKNYKFRHYDGTPAEHDGTHDGTHDRKKVFRQRQKTLIDLLKAKGVKANSRMGFNELLTLCQTHHIDTNQTLDGTPADMTEQKNNPKNQAINNNHKPITNNHKPNNISPQTPQGEVSEHEQTQTFETAPQTTSTGNAKNTAPKMLNVSFDEFWDLYDKKQDRPKCERLWSKLKDQERLDIMTYIPKYKQAQPDKQYRKNPQTFLNNRSWENELVTATESNQQAKQPVQFGGVDDPLAVNQHWKDYPTPANWEENLAKLMAEGQNHKSGLVEI